MKKYIVSGFEILEFEKLTSTNTKVTELSGDLQKDKQVVLTYHQTAGRGQAGNTWESEPGRNLSLSVILKPAALEASKQFAVSMIVSLACADFFSGVISDVTIKWPNDIYVGDKKIGGILIEHQVMGANIARSICGIGLNINQEKFFSDAPNPVSLYQLTGKNICLGEALSGLLEALDVRYKKVNDYDLLLDDYRCRMYRKSGMFKWRDRRGIFDAKIEGVNEYGQLLLKDTSENSRVYGFKEIAYI